MTLGGGRPYKVITGRDGRDTLELVRAVYESAREGRPVVLAGAAR